MIDRVVIEQIGESLSASTLGDSSIEALRAQYPDIHFTYCMDDDVCGFSPFLEREGFNLYLIDSRDHCLAITQDREIATGILVAEVEEEEE